MKRSSIFRRSRAGWSRGNRLMMTAALLMLTSQFVAAKKEKSPTPAPSMPPTTSVSPSIFPTKNPTLGPTLVPSDSPSTSNAPSEFKTPSPTLFPSKSPTLSPTAATSSPTRLATGTPTTSLATDTPTTSLESATPSTNLETASPTALLTLQKELVYNVTIPKIGIDVIVSDSDAASKSMEDLESEMVEFFDYVLARSSGESSFDYVVLDFGIITSLFNRRRLDTGLSMQINGVAYFGSKAPTEEELALDLRAYFAVWGMEDLVYHFQVMGLRSAELVSVAIDGDVVKPAGGPGKIAGASVAEQPTESRDPTISPGIIAGLAAGCTVLAAALVVILIQSRKRHKRSSSRANSRAETHRGANQLSSSKDDSDTEVAVSSPQDFHAQTSHNSDDSDGRSVGAESVDLSLYTTDESLAHAPTISKLYDTKRLDKVIAMARQHSDTSEQKEKSEQRLAI